MRPNSLQKFLYSQSQHDDEDDIGLSIGLRQVNQNFLDHNEYEKEQSENGSHDLGNGESRYGESRYEENDDEKDWEQKEKPKVIFRNIVGDSQTFLNSMSLDQKQPRNHENSINTLNYKSLLNQKKKQQQQVNEVLGRELDDLQELLLKEKDLNRILKKRIDTLENEVIDIKSEKKLLESSIAEYHVNLERKDVLFNRIRDEYQTLLGGVEDMDQKSLRYEETIKSMQKQINDLRNALKIYSDKDIGLMDFRILPNTRRESTKSVYSTTSNESAIEIEKLKQQKKNLETQCQYAKQDLERKEEKFKSLQDDLRRKIALKQKQIKELTQSYESSVDENKKLKKTNENNSSSLRQKVLKLEKDSVIKQEKVKEIQAKLKIAMEEIKKKQEKIRQLLTEIGDKNKKLNELKEDLQQEQGRNQIQTRLQKERQNQIDKLEQQVKELKSQKFNLKRELESLEKPSNCQAKYKKEIEILNKQKSQCTKQNGELLLEIEILEKQNEDMKNKLNGLKKKNQKKLKSQNEETASIIQQNQEYKQMLQRINKENLELKKKAETSQEMANKLFILQSRLRLNQEESMDHSLEENQYDLQEINTALSEQLQNRQHEMNSMRQSHQREIYRLSKEIQTLQKTISTLDSEIQFKEKSLDFMHSKFVEIEKENTSLKASKNILHSSFYEESEQQQQAYKYYENRIADLEDKNRKFQDALRQKQHIVKKANSGKQGLAFEIQQLKQRIKDLQSMVVANDSSKKFVPQSLSPQETIDFLMKMLKRVCKSQDILRSLVRIPDFRTITEGLFKTVNKSYQ